MPTHRDRSWTVIPDAVINNVFGDAQQGAAADTAIVVIANNTSATITTVRCWLEVAPAGATLEAQVLDATPRAAGYRSWPAAPVSGWSTPTVGAPLTLPDIPAGYGIAVVLRRTLAGAAVAWPEINAVVSSATEPI